MYNGVLSAAPARDGKAILKASGGQRDFVLEGDIRVAPGGDAGFIFRVKDADGFESI